jgi:hypothetical protein
MYPAGLQGNMLAAVRKVLPGAHVWTSAQDAVRYLAQASHEGAKPITELVMAGLDFPGHAQADIYPNQLSPKQQRQIRRATGASPGQLIGGPGTAFGGQDLSGPPYSYSTFSNDWDYASKKNGPPRVWFAKNANVYGIGCGTTYFWATNWADMMRQNVTVHGTAQVAEGGPLGFRFLPSATWLATLQAVKAARVWVNTIGNQ